MEQVIRAEKEFDAREYWNNKWSDDAYRMRRQWSTYQAAIEAMKVARDRLKLQSMMAVDIGCGVGGLLDALIDISGITAFGIDISEVAIEHCRYRGRIAMIGNAMEPRIIGKVDVVFAVNVLRYLEDPIQALSNWRKLVHPKGIISLVEKKGIDDSDNAEKWYWPLKSSFEKDLEKANLYPLAVNEEYLDGDKFFVTSIIVDTE